MPDISEIVVNGTTYNVKDTTARSSGGSSSGESGGMTESNVAVLMNEEFSANASAIVLDNVSIRRFILLCLPKGTSENASVGNLKFRFTFTNGKTIEFTHSTKITGTTNALLWNAKDVAGEIRNGVFELSIGTNGSKNDILFNGVQRPSGRSIDCYWEEDGYDSIKKIELFDSTGALIGAGTKIKIVGC